MNRSNTNANNNTKEYVYEDETYLEQNPYYKQEVKQIPKKRIDYDDILRSMNVQVVNGVLRYERQEVPNYQQPLAPNYQQSMPTYQQSIPTYQEPLPQQKKIIPLPNEVKNSAIYNKYFKDYKEEQQVQEVPTILTKEELKKRAIQQYVERINAQKRLSIVKPKTMFFNR
jgi:hypothetical protein